MEATKQTLREAFIEYKDSREKLVKKAKQDREDKLNQEIQNHQTKAQADFNSELKDTWDRIIIRALNEDKHEVRIDIGEYEGDYAAKVEYYIELVKLAIAHIKEAGLIAIDESTLLTEKDSGLADHRFYKIHIKW